MEKIKILRSLASKKTKRIIRELDKENTRMRQKKETKESEIEEKVTRKLNNRIIKSRKTKRSRSMRRGRRKRTGEITRIEKVKKYVIKKCNKKTKA